MDIEQIEREKLKQLTSIADELSEINSHLVGIEGELTFITNELSKHQPNK